jgi:hypothetical protein
MHLHDILSIEIDAYCLTRYLKHQELRIFETGTIRGDQDHSSIGDGWSTLFFAKLEPAEFYSYDLDTRVADIVLSREGVQKNVCLCQEHSIDGLARLLRARAPGDPKFDIAFLDSDNDAQLIFHEFLIAKELVKPRGLIIVDDCAVLPEHDRAAHKGDVLHPWLLENSWHWTVRTRDGWNGYKTGVLVIERF